MNYRADIDGIRAIAVSIVILFHFGVAGFGGGFIGVDVFFVLSGYLISSIIFAKNEKGRFEFGDFYFRRIRRLFPVYMVVIAVTFALAFVLMLPRDFREFGQSLLASTIYMSNVLFYLEAGYFDTASHLKPLLHTWSLSVEEQFYLIFPLVAWITATFSRRSLFILFSILTALSFLAAALYIDTDHSAVFYLYPFRAWEMFLGTLLATHFIPAVRSTSLINTFSIIGLLLIFVPGFTYSETTMFPGVSALAPCVGTALLLYAGADTGAWIQRILASSIPVFIGKISYSLYLWHWPIFVLYSYSKPEGINHWDISLMAAATIAASILSWRFVETPFRQGRVIFSDRKSTVFAATAVMSGVCMVAGFYIHITNGMPQRLDERTAEFAQAAGDLFGDLRGCEEEDNATLPNIAYCTVGDPFNSESYTLIWGDSHGGAYKRGYSSLVEREGNNQHALIAWSGGCPPVYGLNKDENIASTIVDQQCSSRNQAIQELLETDNRIKAIVLVGRWAYYLNGGGVGVDDKYQITIWPDGSEPGSVEDEASYFTSSFLDTVKILSEQGKKVFVVEQPPEFSRYQARTLAIGLMNGRADLERSIQELATEDYNQVLSRQGKMQASLESAEDLGILTVLRTHSYFCKEKNCSLMVNGSPTYFDNNHVSSTGAVQINTMFEPVVRYMNSIAKKP